MAKGEAEESGVTGAAAKARLAEILGIEGIDGMADAENAVRAQCTPRRQGAVATLAEPAVRTATTG